VKSRETDLPGVVVLEPKSYSDHRGSFFECYNQRILAAVGITASFVQDNQSRSRRGVLRGLHYQLGQPQDKLVRAISGEIFDVVVDIRQGSPTFGRWTSVILSAENTLLLYVPKGFAHGFAVLSETAEVVYKCSDFYAPSQERGVTWNDPELAIPWPVAEPILSDKDVLLPTLATIPAGALPAYRPGSA
jgi:dTDP-4-dehydrorhamnose 3,5-epimerase